MLSLRSGAQVLLCALFCDDSELLAAQAETLAEAVAAAQAELKARATSMPRRKRPEQGDEIPA